MAVSALVVAGVNVMLMVFCSLGLMVSDVVVVVNAPFERVKFDNDKVALPVLVMVNGKVRLLPISTWPKCNALVEGDAIG